MNAIEELRNRINGDIILIDSCALTPSEEISLSELLYNGIDGLEMVDPTIVTSRIGRLQDIERLRRTNQILLIPQVCQEADKHLQILNTQTSYITSEIREMKSEIEPEDYSYYRDLIENIHSYNLTLHQFFQKIRKDKQQTTLCNRVSSPYLELLSTARNRSKDLLEKTYVRKENHRHPVHLGEDLETDQHLAATAFTLAYTNPVTLVTGDNGLIELVRRVYESIHLGHVRTPCRTQIHRVPPYTVNCFNPYPYDQEETKRLREIENRMDFIRLPPFY